MHDRTDLDQRQSGYSHAAEAQNVSGARRDAGVALVSGAVAFAVYVRTLAPGLVAVADTPMFQFIGRVLGVPHNPGYPFYVLTTHLVSKLPIGSLPYRINLFSAVLGAVAVSLTYLLARHLGCRPVISAAAALGLAFGGVFWSQAVIAEVYTLHAAIVAGMLVALLAWRRTRRDRDFFVAVILFAAGLGHHTTIVAFAPGMLLFVLLTDRRFAFRLRTIALTAAILAAGLLQYAFILIRSGQRSAYLESRATNLTELMNVVLGRQFSDRLFAFGAEKVLRDRLPGLLEHVLVPELTAVGLVLAAIGALWLLRYRFAEAVLVLPGLVLIVGFTVNYRVVDTAVFVIPAILVLWLTAAVALEQAARWARRWSAAGVAVGVAALVLPAWNVTHNFVASDRSRDTRVAVLFDALFAALPDRAVLVHEDFLVDRMVMFKLIGEDAAHGRQIALAPARPEELLRRRDAGFDVFAFQKFTSRLRHAGLDFAFEPLRLLDGSLADYLEDLPDGAIVAVAMPATHTRALQAGAGPAWRLIGAPDALNEAVSNAAIVGVRGARAGALVRTGGADLVVEVGAGQELGETGRGLPSAVQIQAHGTEAAIRLDGRDLVRTTRGAAVAVWSANGRLERAVALQAGDAFRAPVATGPLSVYRLRGRSADQPIEGGWTDVTRSLTTGSFGLRVPGRGNVVLEVTDDAPLAPRVLDRSSGARLTVTALDGSEAETDRGPGANTRSVIGESEFSYRIEARSTGSSPTSALIALGGIPRRARACLRHDSGGATIFRVDTIGLLRSPDSGSEVLLMARDEQAQLTGHGWSRVEANAAGPYRWIAAPQARVVLPVGRENTAAVRIEAWLRESPPANQRRGTRAAGGPGNAGLRLIVDGSDAGVRTLREGWHSYDWTLASGALRPGVHEIALAIEPPGDGEQPAEPVVAIGEIRLLQTSH